MLKFVELLTFFSGVSPYPLSYGAFNVFLKAPASPRKNSSPE